MCALTLEYKQKCVWVSIKDAKLWVLLLSRSVWIFKYVITKGKLRRECLAGSGHNNLPHTLLIYSSIIIKPEQLPSVALLRTGNIKEVKASRQRILGARSNSVLLEPVHLHRASLPHPAAFWSLSIWINNKGEGIEAVSVWFTADLREEIREEQITKFTLQRLAYFPPPTRMKKENPQNEQIWRITPSAVLPSLPYSPTPWSAAAWLGSNTFWRYKVASVWRERQQQYGPCVVFIHHD